MTAGRTVTEYENIVLRDKKWFFVKNDCFWANLPDIYSGNLKSQKLCQLYLCQYYLS